MADPFPEVCKRCTGTGHAHRLWCPVINLPAGYDFAEDGTPKGDQR